MKQLLLVFILSMIGFVAESKPIRSSISLHEVEEMQEEEPIPYDRVLYLEQSDTKAYIDTGIYLESSDIIDMGFVNSIDPNGAWNRGIGFSLYTDSHNMVDILPRANPLQLGSIYLKVNEVTITFSGKFGEYEHLHIESGYTYLNNQINTSVWNYREPYDLKLCLFAWHRRLNTTGQIVIDSNYCRGSQVGEFSITRNGEKIIDLVAVKFINENDEWEGAMYDKVSGDLFRNDGSGSFVIGPNL